jgi:hypothetical protein
MPAQPIWYHRLPAILAEVEELQTGYLDRSAVEKLFGIRERRARQIMSRLPCVQVGNAIAVERPGLIRFLRSIADEEKFQWEVGRRSRLAEELERVRLQLSARKVSIPTPADRIGVALAERTQLRPGELRITFHDAEDLAAQLFQLSQAMASDWSAFKKAAEDGLSPVGVGS